MKVSSKGDYGLRALFDLAQHYGQGLVQSAEIAARQDIPENYLSQLLIVLRRGGLVHSLRGPRGGHMLARPPDRITLGQAVAVLEGSTAPAPCVRENGETADCSLVEECVLRDVWCEIKTAIDHILDHITLDDLCQRALARRQQIMYYI